jgi:hypothetical protein
MNRGYLGLWMPVSVDLPLIDVQMDRTASHNGKRSVRGYTTQTAGLYPGWGRHGRRAKLLGFDVELEH